MISIYNIDTAATSERIKRLMKEKNINAKEMARHTGVSISAVYKWINGSSLPGYELAEDLVELFGLCRIEDLVVMNKIK